MQTDRVERQSERASDRHDAPLSEDESGVESRGGADPEMSTYDPAHEHSHRQLDTVELSDVGLDHKLVIPE